MTYNFDKLIERRGTGCVKWDEMTDKDIIPMWIADMDFPVAPAIQEAIKRRASHPVFGYTYVQDDYYNAVISWFKRRHQWHIQREWMLYTTGVVPAMSVAIKALTLPGERVLILSPDYNCFFSSIHNNGCEVLESVLQFNDDSNKFEIDWQNFEQHCADEKCTVFLLCNPHNPTGRIWSREELQHMAALCKKHHVRIVSDEIHCELTMPGHTFVPMGVVDPDAIILNSPSKSFNIAGLTMANIICQDAETRRRLDRAINIHEVCDVNPFAPEATKAAYNESEDWIDELNLYIWDNYHALKDFCSQHLPQWHVMPLEGTYLVWVDVSRCCDDVTTYCDDLLQNAKVWLNPGIMYGKESGKGFIRINLACPRSLLMEALERIQKLNKQ
jgi:cystathionine beta-lyase